eukprot:gene13914-16000_t
MNFQAVWRIISCVLYELQPFRIVDVIDLSKYLYASVWDLGSAGVTLSDLVYQSAFYGIASMTHRTWALIILWLTAFAVMNYLEFGSLWIILSMFASIFLNLGKRKRGEMSAYNVFNDGFKQLLGTMKAEQFDNEIRHGAFQREDIQEGEFVQFDDAFHDESDLEEEAFPAQRNRRPNIRQNRHQRRVQQLAAANMEQAHNQQNPNNNNINIIPPVVRRKGKKGRRTYEERLLRRETANLQRRQREGNMGGEFDLDSDIDEKDEE